MTGQQQASWNDLSDDELRVRLAQRGYSNPILTYWVDSREDHETVLALNGILERD